MNDMNSIITADAQKRIEEFTAMAQDAESQIKHLEDVKVFAAQKIAEYGKVLANLPDDGQTESYSVQWFNTDNLTGTDLAPVVVHGEGCNHIKKALKDPYMKAGLEKVSDVEQWESAEDFAKDYNAEFYAEDGQDGAWDIAFFPCTGMVEKVKVMTGYED